MSALEESRSKLVDELDFVQKKAFTKWVNSHLEKAGIEIEDLFQDLRDGSILLLLLELFTGTKLKRERGKMKVHHIQNVQTAKSFLTDKKHIKIVGIPAEEIVAGNKKLTLGLIWTLILNFQLSCSLPLGNDTRPTSPKQVSAKVIKEELLQWSQRATEGYEIKTTNFHKSWKNGMAFCAIINRHRPDLLDIDDCDPSKPLQNLEKAFTTAETELGVTRFLDPEDINVEKPSEEAILMYVSALKQAFPDMPPSHRRKEGSPVSPEEYTTSYVSLQQWMTDRLKMTANESLPATADEVRQLLKDFQKLRSTEDSEKEKEKEKVRTMAAEIMVFELKNKKDFGVPNIKELEQSWSECMTASNDYETSLKDKIARLEQLDDLAQKVQLECSSVSSILTTMEEQVEQFESEGGVSSEDDEVTELQSNLKSVKDTIESQENSIQLLKEGSHPQWSHFDEIVSGFWNTLSSLRGRLDKCVTSVSDIRVLLAEADTKLRVCEMWLLEHGKFCDNQLIVEQKDTYQTFTDIILSDTKSVMNKVNSTPLPGCVDEIRDLNKRWDQIQEQLQSRITNLSSIIVTVNEFDVVKLPLQDWCVQQQNETLPLLETDPQELIKQKEEFQQVLSQVLSYQSAVETLENLSVDFLKHKEPIQTFADKYARRLKRVSRNFASAVIKDPSQNTDDDSNQVSLFEQSEILRSEWERNKSHIQRRLDQADDLLERLNEFERLHSALLLLIVEGTVLLDSEHPVGGTAQRIEEQTDSCQAFRVRLTEAQPKVDTMLGLGRSIIGEYYTNPDKDTLSQTLTDFISNWSNLLLSWQNWFDELHATGEQSRDLSEQFVQLKQSYQIMEPKHTEIFPATVTMETLDSDLKNLQDQFNKELLEPVQSLKRSYSSLSSNVHLLSEKEEVERMLSSYMILLERVESQGSELDDVIDNVECWWSECSAIQCKVEEMRYSLVEDLPLAGSVLCIKKQDEHIQNLLLRTEEMNPKILRAIKHLSSLADHETLFVCKPILLYKDELQQHWKDLHEQVETRRDVVEIGRVRLNVYVENRDPFNKWLDNAETQLNKWRGMANIDKMQLMESSDSLKAFKMDVEMHYHEMESCVLMGNKYTDTAKKYQSNLSVYRQKLHPDLSTSQLPPEHFFDWETESVTIGTINGEEMPSVHNHNYCNGLKVVSIDINILKRRFNRLKGRVTRRTARFVEARDKRITFQESLEIVLPKLEQTESLLHKLLDVETNSKNLKEQLELMEVLESEFSSLRSLMDPLNMSAAAWTVRDPLDSESEDTDDTTDQYMAENEQIQERYLKVEQAMHDLRENLESSLAEAQAFHSSFSSFASWLRDAERKIQKDDPLKLETTDLKSGLAYLKAVKSDISGHTQSYHELCKKFESAIELGKKGEKDDLKEKLDILESRWNSIQVIQEDIEAIECTLSSLESFNVAYQIMTRKIDELIGRFRIFSPSAITSEDVEKKKSEFEELLAQFNSCQSEFYSLLSKYEEDLFNTPFDQTKFLQHIDIVKTQIMECKKLKDEKSRAMKHIVTRIKTLEMNWAEFESWLAASEDKMTNLDQSLVNESRVNLTDQLKQVQVLQEDITDHETLVESIESLVASLASYLEHHHMEKLQTRFNNLFGRYRCLYFSSEAFPVQVWIHNRKLDIIQMNSCAVLVRLLQFQIQEMNKYKTQLESYELRFTELKQLMQSLPEQSNYSIPEAKMANIEAQYAKLGKVATQREKVLLSSLPRLKLYENSLNNWRNTLTGWEESALHLAPPTTAVLIIESTIENIKALQVQISNQEPEFYSLMREARQMYTGSEDDRLLVEKLKTLGIPHHPTEQSETKPGQLELQERLGDYQKRLDNLKKKIQSLLSTLKALNDKTTSFNKLLNQLLPWLQDQQLMVTEELQLTDPSYQVLQSQRAKCQGIQNDLKLKKLEKTELMDVYNDIIACLPPESDDAIAIKGKMDEVLTCWTGLSDQITVAQSRLDPSTKLAKSFENGQEKLTAFIKLALNELTGLGPIPSEPEAVQELKIRIDELKSEYNSLIQLFRKCTEDGNKLLEYCSQHDHLKDCIEELETRWSSVGTMLTDIHQKLTEALVQTQEFQQVAESLDRWVNATQSSLKRLEPPAVRVRLIQPQIEGLKPVIEDISVNTDTLEQVKIIGEQLLAEATTEERLKINKKLHSLEMRFYGLEKTTKTRTKELQDALIKATEFESVCSELSDWLNSLEDQFGSLSATPIRSQPLIILMERVKEFTSEVTSHEPLMITLSNTEVILFLTDMKTIEKYELRENFIEYLSSPQHSRGPSPMHSQRSDTPVESNTTSLQDGVMTVSPVHPDFLDRPGCLDALEIGAKLRNRFKKLKHGCSRREGEVDALLKNVVRYEKQCTTFTDWLQVIDDKLQGQEQLTVSCEKLKSILQMANALQNEMANHEETLETINSTGTALVEGCHDDLTLDSVRESLSDLNDQWGSVTKRLDDRLETVKQGLTLTNSYEAMENDFCSWLNDTEAKLDRPVSITGSSSEMQQIIRKLDIIQSDIDSHKAHSDSLITTGESLESFASSNGITDISPLNYMNCKSRYEGLIYKLNNKRKGTVDNVKKASQLKDQLTVLLEKLKPFKTQLDNHEPPQILPELITEQIHSLETAGSEYTTLENNINQLSDVVNCFHLEEGSELFNLYQSVCSLSKDIEASQKQWLSKLHKARDSALQFDKGYNNFSQWISTVQQQLHTDEGIRATVGGVERQIQTVQDLVEDISNHSQTLQKLMDNGRNMMIGASPENCISIGDKLAHIQSGYESLQRHAFGRVQSLKDGFVKVKEFNDEHEMVLEKLQDKARDIQIIPSVGTEVETVRTQLEEFKDFEYEIVEMKSKVSSCQLKGKHIKDTCYHDDKSKVEDKLEELNTEWNKLQSLSVARQQELENALLRLGQFREAFLELIGWIRECSQKLSQRKEPGVDVEDLEQQLQDLKVLQSEIVSRDPSVTSLNNASKKLIVTSQDEASSKEIQTSMAQLGQEWQDLKSLAANQQLILSTAHERARVFVTDLREIMKQFNAAEEDTSEDWLPHALPDTCEHDLVHHQQLATVIQELKDPMINIKSEAEGLKGQASQNEYDTLTRLMADMEDRWERLVTTLEEKQIQLELAKVSADNFDKELVTITGKLDNLEIKVNESSSIHSEADEVKRQLKEHKELLELLDKCESEIEAAESVGGAMIKDCVPDDGKIIRKQLAKLRCQYDQLQSLALTRLSHLEEALLTVGKFEEAYQELQSWLVQAWDKLQSLEPIPSQSEAVIALYAKHKVFMKELLARSQSHTSVIKAGKELMKTKRGEDKNILKSKMADLDHEWDGVSQMSTDYQQKLENAIKKLRQFESQAQPIKSWMMNILPILDDSQPVDGDTATVHELAHIHETFQNELGAHQHNIDGVINLGEEIMIDVVDNISPLKETLDQIKELWDKICNLSVSKQERILKAQKTSSQFQQSVRTLWSWLEQKEAEIDLMALPTENEHELHQQIQQHTMFEETVQGHQHVYDQIMANGQNLHRVSHPKAEPIIAGQLQQLQQKWKQLKGKIHSRSEVLESLLLEIHGLQDSIDELSKWVGSAEEDLTNAEEMPIGEDMDSVETQLNYHEAFQEEMAKHQPKMEALNKASKRRKSRASLVPGSASSPEITKKISNLDRKWKKLWLRSNERHRQLLEARTRLKDIALARSFNFDAWCKKFVTWVDQQKLRVSDLFRRFDSNHDGMLSREEFMKGLKASGLAMNQIEMEKIADSFDRNRSGNIDLAEITAVLKSQKVYRQFKTSASAKPISETEKIDLEIQEQISKCCCDNKYQAVPVKAGQYKFGDSQKLRLVRILRSTVMVRVGGGWEPLDTFLAKNDPCRSSSRTNVVLLPNIGVGKVIFKSKVQTAITAKSDETKKMAERDPSVKKVTKTLHDGRQETVITKKTSVPAIKTTSGRESPVGLRRASTASNIGNKGASTPTRKASTLSRFTSPPGEGHLSTTMRPRTPSTPADSSLPRAKTPSRNGTYLSAQTTTPDKLRPPSRGAGARTSFSSKIPTPSSKIPPPSSRGRPPSRQK